MLRIDVKHDMDALIRKMDLRRDRVPFAASVALNATATATKAAERQEMERVFDRPTPYTLNSLFIKPSTKASLTAKVWLKDTSVTFGGDHYLTPQIYGGSRPVKRFEKMLRQVLVVPMDFVAVPGRAAKLDGYGNISRGQIQQLLAYFQAFYLSGTTSANMDKKRRDKLAKGTKTKQGYSYFVGRPGGGKLPPGIWQRFQFAAGSSIKPIIIFVDHADYKKRLDFFAVAERVYGDTFLPEFRKAYALAMQTARPA
jgi:hypothetical protein